MFTIFKRGRRRELKNYRGITIIYSMTKLYDLILCAGLNQWFKHFRELGGAHPTSCLLFIIYVNDLIKMVKENCEPDGFLS